MGPRHGVHTGNIFIAQPEDGLLELFDRLGVAAWFTDTDGVVDNCNATACNLIKDRKTDLLGKRFCEDIVSSEQHEQSTVAIKAALLGGDTSDLELSILTRREQLRPIIAEVCPRMRGLRVTGSMILGWKVQNNLEFQTLNLTTIDALLGQ